MKRFSFGLERILEWRRVQRDEEALALQKALSERAAVVDRERALRHERDRYVTGLANALHFDADEVATLPHWQLRVKTTLEKMAAAIAEADARVAGQRDKMREAERKLQLLERLRDKRLGEWKAALDREEEAFASEMYLARSARLNLDRPV
jgi:flagellar export protein FliJ